MVERWSRAAAPTRLATVTRLIVFADDWGRHPSSCQHLVRVLLERHPVTWVNTIGMRRPGRSHADLAKIAQRIGQWTNPRVSSNGDVAATRNLTVLTPFMWPGFNYGWERTLNAALVGRALGTPRNGERRVVLTTLPITAALLDKLHAAATIYYCVDDVSAWPGINGDVMTALEADLLQRCDRVIATSAVLQQQLAARGREVDLLTHGVDVALWNGAVAQTTPRWTTPGWAQGLRRPIALFWGLIDHRLDLDWLRALQDGRIGTGGSLVLAGPIQDPDPALRALDRVVMLGPVPYESLPQLAALADVLVMPYGDSAATRAMYPLKWNEYLMTRKPVIARNLPATCGWADAADLVESADAFARIAAQRAGTAAPEAQLRARQRVRELAWARKAAELEALLANYL